MKRRWFKDLCARFARLPPHARTAESVRRLCAEVGLFTFEVTSHKKGRFTVFEGFRVVLPSETIFLPILSPGAIDRNSQRGTPWRNAVTQCGWITPSYIQMGVLSAITSKVAQAPPELREAVVDAALPDLYRPGDIAAMILDRYEKTPSIQPYVPLIREAVECFYLGKTHAAVAALVPVIEGIMRRTFEFADSSTGTSLLAAFVHRALTVYKDEFLYNGDRLPPEYEDEEFIARTDEYVLMLLTFREYARAHLYQRTDRFESASGLNRPGILHGTIVNFGKEPNFYRLISLLDFLTFVNTMNGSGISCLAPDMTPRAWALAHYYVGLIAIGRTMQKVEVQALSALTGPSPAA